jgi:Helix-turn-helix
VELNKFQNFLTLVDPLKDQFPEAAFEVSEPAQASGFRTWAIDLPEGFSVEVEWKKSCGFGIVAGTEFFMGEGVHEIYSEPDAAAERVISLVECREATTGDFPVTLAELRKLRGKLQTDVAQVLGITKSGLAQIESSAATGKVQVDTLQRLIGSLGGRLVISAEFLDGSERRVAIGN